MPPPALDYVPAHPVPPDRLWVRILRCGYLFFGAITGALVLTSMIVPQIMSRDLHGTRESIANSLVHLSTFPACVDIPLAFLILFESPRARRSPLTYVALVLCILAFLQPQYARA